MDGIEKVDSFQSCMELVRERIEKEREEKKEYTVSSGHGRNVVVHVLHCIAV